MDYGKVNKILKIVLIILLMIYLAERQVYKDSPCDTCDYGKYKNFNKFMKQYYGACINNVEKEEGIVIGEELDYLEYENEKQNGE